MKRHIVINIEDPADEASYGRGALIFSYMFTDEEANGEPGLHGGMLGGGGGLPGGTKWAARRELAREIDKLIRGDEASDEYHYLCGACGAIRRASAWTFWQRDDEGEHWRPSRDSEGDPMCRCPECGYEHTEMGVAAMIDGSLEDLIAHRAELAEQGEAFDLTDYRPSALDEDEERAREAREARAQWSP